MELTRHIRDVPDFPKPGIVFKDITPLLADPTALQWSIDTLAERFADSHIDRVIGIESRGFLFGPGIALRLGCGFAPMRKPGKLPWRTVRRDYQLEYGSDTLEMHVDAIAAGDRVLLVDDLLATGGTMAAAVGLCGDCGAEVVGVACVVELAFLGGAARLDRPVEALIRYD